MLILLDLKLLFILVGVIQMNVGGTPKIDLRIYVIDLENIPKAIDMTISIPMKQEKAT